MTSDELYRQLLGKLSSSADNVQAPNIIQGSNNIMDLLNNLQKTRRESDNNELLKALVTKEILFPDDKKEKGSNNNVENIIANNSNNSTNESNATNSDDLHNQKITILKKSGNNNDKSTITNSNKSTTNDNTTDLINYIKNSNTVDTLLNQDNSKTIKKQLELYENPFGVSDTNYSKLSPWNINVDNTLNMAKLSGQNVLNVPFNKDNPLFTGIDPDTGKKNDSLESMIFSNPVLGARYNQIINNPNLDTNTKDKLNTIIKYFSTNTLTKDSFKIKGGKIYLNSSPNNKGISSDSKYYGIKDFNITPTEYNNIATYINQIAGGNIALRYIDVGTGNLLNKEDSRAYAAAVQGLQYTNYLNDTVNGYIPDKGQLNEYKNSINILTQNMANYMKSNDDKKTNYLNMMDNPASNPLALNIGTLATITATIFGSMPKDLINSKVLSEYLVKFSVDTEQDVKKVVNANRTGATLFGSKEADIKYLRIVQSLQHKLFKQSTGNQNASVLEKIPVDIPINTTGSQSVSVLFPNSSQVLSILSKSSKEIKKLIDDTYSYRTKY